MKEAAALSYQVVRRPRGMKKLWIFLPMAVLLISGCSKNDWLAKVSMWKAENAYQKGSELRLKKVPYEERLSHYREACDNFLKSYQLKPGAFTLNRLECAADSCLRVGDYEGEDIFRERAAQYMKDHPKESSYGDAFPMSDM